MRAADKAPAERTHRWTELQQKCCDAEVQDGPNKISLTDLEFSKVVAYGAWIEPGGRGQWPAAVHEDGQRRAMRRSVRVQ